MSLPLVAALHSIAIVFSFASYGPAQDIISNPMEAKTPDPVLPERPLPVRQSWPPTGVEDDEMNHFSGELYVVG